MKKNLIVEDEAQMGGEDAAMTLEDNAESIVVDLSNVEDAGFKPLPKGMYDCVLEQLEYKISQKGGNPMWSWTLEVQGPEEFAGRKLFYHTVFKGAGLPMTKRTLGRVFPSLLAGPFDPKKIADEGSLLGTKIKARVDIKPYEGEQRNNVKDLYAGDSGESFLNA